MKKRLSVLLAAALFAALPLKTQWILKPSLNYETVIPTTDGKNWIGSRKSSGGEENFLINTAGKVLAQADFMNYGTQQQFGVGKDIPSRCIALVGENLKEKYSGEDDELPISSFFGYGAVINGELKSTTLYKELSLLKGFSDWRRDLYIAGTGTEYLFTNTAGKAVLTEKFADLSANENCTAAAVKQNRKWGFIRVPEL